MHKAISLIIVLKNAPLALQSSRVQQIRRQSGQSDVNIQRFKRARERDNIGASIEACN